jgi:hypothetical protein
MELVWLGVFLAGLLVLDILALRFGADSRFNAADHRNW